MPLRALYEVPAPAKLNLFLHVVGRRADGYQLLQSVFTLIDWSDRLHFEVRADGRLARHDLGTALPADDLCLRAARALQGASGCTLGVDISIDKQVPWGAGLGGGSSDAAATLLALNRLWGLNWTRRRLCALGLTLGADVPFFVGGRNAFVEGVGERLRPLQVPAALYAVVKPAAAIATRDVFEHPLLVRDTDPVILLGSFEDGKDRVADQAADRVVGWPAQWNSDSDLAPLFGRNDLQAAAQDRCPEVAQVARWLQDRYGNSRMTGSGSAVFARIGLNEAVSLEAVPPQATGLAEELPQGWVGRLCRSLDAHPLVGWSTD